VDIHKVINAVLEKFYTTFISKKI